MTHPKSAPLKFFPVSLYRDWLCCISLSPRGMAGVPGYPTACVYLCAPLSMGKLWSWGGGLGPTWAAPHMAGCPLATSLFEPQHPSLVHGDTLNTHNFRWVRENKRTYAKCHCKNPQFSWELSSQQRGRTQHRMKQRPPSWRPHGSAPEVEMSGCNPRPRDLLLWEGKGHKGAEQPGCFPNLLTLCLQEWLWSLPSAQHP